MDCQGLLTEGGCYRWFYRNHLNRLPCCGIADAEEKLMAYTYATQQKNLLAQAEGRPVRKGRIYGWRRWLRPTYSPADALYKAHRAGRRKRW